MATVEEAIQNIRLSTIEDQANRININSQYGAMGSIGGSVADTQRSMQEAERAMQLRQREEMRSQGLLGMQGRQRVQEIQSAGLVRLQESFPSYVSHFLDEEIEDGQETSENIPEDKEALSIQVKKNKKGITLGVPKLAPIVTIYNLQDDVVLLDTSTLEDNELMSRKEFMELMTVQIKKKEPVILKDGFYISVSGVSIAKDRVKANCFKNSNRQKVTEEQFFAGELKDPKERILPGGGEIRVPPNFEFEYNQAPVAMYSNGGESREIVWGDEQQPRFQDDAHRARYYSQQHREEMDEDNDSEPEEDDTDQEEVPQRRSRRRRSAQDGPPRERPLPPRMQPVGPPPEPPSSRFQGF